MARAAGCGSKRSCVAQPDSRITLGAGSWNGRSADQALVPRSQAFLTHALHHPFDATSFF